MPVVTSAITGGSEEPCTPFGSLTCVAGITGSVNYRSLLLGHINRGLDQKPRTQDSNRS